VGEAVDGREAVEIARRVLPHVALLDIATPVLNIIEAARQISPPLFRTLAGAMHSSQNAMFVAVVVVRRHEDHRCPGSMLAAACDGAILAG
jgi:DNA-binding NarL/FixJ family response regulator